MVVRKRGRRQKQLGERTHGHGDTKNNRGAGNRGGHGRAGSHKHKFSKYYMTFGVKVRQHAAPKGKAVNVWQLVQSIPQWKKEGKVAMEDGRAIIDGKVLKIQTLLGGGKIAQEVLIRNMRVTEKARTKVEEANGEIEDEFDAATEGKAGAASEGETAE